MRRVGTKIAFREIYEFFTCSYPDSHVQKMLKILLKNIHANKNNMKIKIKPLCVKFRVQNSSTRCFTLYSEWNDFFNCSMPSTGLKLPSFLYIGILCDCEYRDVYSCLLCSVYLEASIFRFGYPYYYYFFFVYYFSFSTWSVNFVWCE